MRPTASLSSKPWRLALWAASVGAALFLSATAGGAEGNPAQRRPKAETPATAERIIVKFRGAAGLSAQASTNGESAVGASSNGVADTARMNALGSRRGFTVQGVASARRQSAHDAHRAAHE